MNIVSVFFCAASETARDVAESYVCEDIGTLPSHPLEALTISNVHVSLPDMSKANGATSTKFLHMLEAYVDDFIQLVQTKDPKVLMHCSRALMHGIHSVFPPPAVTGHSGKEPISGKKLLESKGLWEIRKEILGWMMDGVTRWIELSKKKQKRSSPSSRQ